jgi:hypothetical protein
LDLKFEAVLLEQEIVVLQVEMVCGSEGENDLAGVFLQDEKVVLLKHISAQDGKVVRGNIATPVRYQSCAESECHD